MAKKRKAASKLSGSLAKKNRSDVDKLTPEFIDRILMRSDIEFGDGKTCPRWLLADCVDIDQEAMLCVELRDRDEVHIVVVYTDIERRGGVTDKSIDLIAVRSASALQAFVFALRVAEVMLPVIPGRLP